MIAYGADYTCSHGEPWGTCCEQPRPIFVDIAALIAGGLPEPPPATILRRDDGRALFYEGKVNVLFGDPESGKTWVALAAVVDTLQAGKRAAMVDLDHNGATEVTSRLLLLGATPKQLSNPDLFRLAEPEDKAEIMETVKALCEWGPAAVVVDSLGELLPIMGGSSNSPDDWTGINRATLGALARAGAAVIAVDHLPKNDESREKGQTGTLAKKRSVNGVSYRVTIRETFAPSQGGSCGLVVEKDRPGQVRRHCPRLGGKTQPAGVFALIPHPEGTAQWRIASPNLEAAASAVGKLAADVAQVAALEPPARSVRDVKDRLKWRTDRAADALKALRAGTSSGGTPGAFPVPHPTGGVGNGYRNAPRDGSRGTLGNAGERGTPRAGDLQVREYDPLASERPDLWVGEDDASEPPDGEW